MCVFKNTNKKNIFASIVFKAESKPKHEEKNCGGVLFKITKQAFWGVQIEVLKLKFRVCFPALVLYCKRKFHANFHKKYLTLSLRLVEKPTQLSNFLVFLHACHTVNKHLITLKFSEGFVHGLTFFGQNTELIYLYCSSFYTCSSKLVKKIRKKSHKNVRTVNFLNFFSKHFLNG